MGQPASRRVAVAFFSLLSTGMHCGDPAQLSLGQPFSLRSGESAVLQRENVRLRFDSVPEDSRCPKTVQCVWAGNARVRLEITVGTDGSVTAARVVDATPPRVFDREALAAVKRWKFAPIDAPVAA